jgi:hypothetical protein
MGEEKKKNKSEISGNNLEWMLSFNRAEEQRFERSAADGTLRTFMKSKRDRDGKQEWHSRLGK